MLRWLGLRHATRGWVTRLHGCNRRDFDFGNATEGEQKLYEVLG